MAHFKTFYGVLAWPRCYGLGQQEYLALLVSVQTDKDSDFKVDGDICFTVWLRDMDTEHRSEEAN